MKRHHSQEHPKTRTFGLADPEVDEIRLAARLSWFRYHFRCAAFYRWVVVLLVFFVLNWISEEEPNRNTAQWGGFIGTLLLLLLIYVPIRTFNWLMMRNTARKLGY